MPPFKVMTVPVCLGLVLALSLPVAATDREPPPRRSLVLEPGPDGLHALPLAPGELVPLRIEPDPAPFRVTSLAYDPEGHELWITLRHAGDRPVSAWSLQVETVSASGAVLSRVRRTLDWSFGEEASGSLAAPGGTPLTSASHEAGLLRPGQTHRMRVPVPTARAEDAPATARVVLSVPLTVYTGGSYEGEGDLAAEVLGARRAAARELAYWTARLEEAADHAGTEEEARAQLGRLAEELAVEETRLPSAAQAVRSNVRGAVESAARAGADSRDELRELEQWFGSRLQGWSRHLPNGPDGAEDDGPEENGGPLRQKSVEEGPIGGDGDGAGLDCDCGGSMHVSVARHETQICNSTSEGWTVDETWSYTCRHEDGSTLGTGSGSLHGVGGCFENVTCYPDALCPPTFSGGGPYQDEQYHRWNRMVTNQRVVIGTCTARCDITTSESLTFECLCLPTPDPLCFQPDTPILIETGGGGFELTGLAGGVRFDLDGDGSTELTSWTSPDGDDAWLVLDRNGNGLIDDGTELFGNNTPQPDSPEPHGFLALAVFDRADEGGNDDGLISAEDAAFDRLRLWHDRNHDGLSVPEELITLPEAGIEALELDYFVSNRQDRHGNRFRYSARVWLASGGQRLAVDVLLVHE